MLQDTTTNQHLDASTEYNAPQKNNNFELVMSQINIVGPNDFQTTFAQQWQSAAIENQLISLLLCEIDFYDEYVEHYGIQGASFMLLSIALILKSSSDKYNCFLAHNEQQGFSILVKGTTEQEVQRIAEHFYEAVNKSKIEHKHSKIAPFITLSMGVSSFYPVTQSTLKANAKKALNIAKAAGGDNVRRINETKALQLIANIDDKSEQQAAIPAPEIKSKQQRSSVKTQTPVSENLDFFAEIEPAASHAARTYRGQVIEKENQDSKMHALKLNKAALNEGKADPSIEKETTKKPRVRMYRGQIISD